MISIIIVNYRVKKELFACIRSIFNSKPKTAYEVIVVDNDEVKNISVDLKKISPQIKYIPNENKGFGQANNIGANHANGKFLFFLNPDTLVFEHTIDNLISFFDKYSKAGIAAPILLGRDKIAYQQGSLELTPWRAIIALSFINKLFPHNMVSKKYFLEDWDKKSPRETDVAPGTAFMISKNLFDEIGGFDEKFFLYFEEFDLCRRIRSLNYKIYINPEAKVLHYWGESTKHRTDINKIFLESRFYYFKKNFGVFNALVVEGILRMNKFYILILLIVALLLLLIIYLG